MATTYDYPDDLLTAQRDLTQVRADLAALLAALPYSVEPIEAWQRPQGYWHDTSRAFPDSPGWTEQEKREVATLRTRELELVTVILTHPLWADVSGPDAPEARSRLKQAALAPGGVDRDELSP
ncbi:nucleic acid-binding protein [Streptomyces bottropensis]|uniref:nucleic acid-binding protein n=1 Tax=Streptomyces bottropensis TaxID=42235 RepID=UPI003689B553